MAHGAGYVLVTVSLPGDHGTAILVVVLYPLVLGTIGIGIGSNPRNHLDAVPVKRRANLFAQTSLGIWIDSTHV